MMQIHFYTLSLQCRESKEIIDLSSQVSFFHGKVSSGKSSIARLINYCLGGGIERTVAITKEVVSVSLELSVGTYKVLLERILGSSNVNATCVNEERSFSILVPVTSGTHPVWGDTVYNLSDLFFYLLNLNVLRIPANRKDENASMVRLSLKNFMWYCYLDQSKLDNSFFRLEDPTKTRNSREVLKYILQYSTQKLLELEEKLGILRKSRISKQMTANGLREFLKKFNFSTEAEIEITANTTKDRLQKARQEKQKIESGYSDNTHFADKIRDQIRGLISDLTIRQNGIFDLETRIEQQETLKSELISSKFKIAKSKSVANVFNDVEFKNCPDCGSSLLDRRVEKETCRLCLSDIRHDDSLEVGKEELVQFDLTERIKELEASIDLHKKALNKTRREFSAKEKLRSHLDIQLRNELKQYESVFLSNVRSLDKRVATLEERLKGIDRLKLMPREINKLENEAISLEAEEKKIKKQISEEQSNFKRGELLIENLEYTFLEILNEIGVPGISPNDKVHINKKTWEVTILPEGEEYLRWNFYNAGSGGKKTLFNTCFLLALHVVASQNDLPLPSFIIIDTPMKNIDKEVNQDIFHGFYHHLYTLASNVLDKTQIIIIDNNYVPPAPTLKLSFNDRYMDSDDPANPPLISYYKGP